MAQPKLPETYTLKGYLYGTMWPGDKEATVSFFAHQPTNGYFFIKEVAIDVPLGEMNVIQAQVAAIKEQIQTIRLGAAGTVAECEERMNKILSLAYEEAVEEVPRGRFVSVDDAVEADWRNAFLRRPRP